MAVDDEQEQRVDSHASLTTATEDRQQETDDNA